MNEVPTFRTEARPLLGPLAVIAEHLKGRRPGMPTPRNAEAADLGTAELVLVREVPQAFTLCVRIGAHWFPVMTVHAGDPGVEALRAEGRIVAFGAPKKGHERWPEPTLEEEIAMRKSWGARERKMGQDARAYDKPPTGPLAPQINIV